MIEKPNEATMQLFILLNGMRLIASNPGWQLKSLEDAQKYAAQILNVAGFVAGKTEEKT